MNPADLSLSALRTALDAREVSAEEVAAACLERIGASDLNAFIDVRPELTLAQARAADERLARGERTPLLGVPIAHKDIFVTRGWRSTAGSRMLEHYVSPFDAAVVEKLAAAGAVCLGKTNCDEFAMGSSNEHSFFGDVRNPWDRAAVAGGSSGGSAAAVAAGLTPLATGTDTGGSIRQPASMCGITGVKPTYGRVSRHGMIAFTPSLDQGGAMARSAADCAVLLGAMTGFDPRDSTSLDRPAEDFACSDAWRSYSDRGHRGGSDRGSSGGSRRDSSTPSSDQPLQGLRIGMPREFFGEGLSPPVRQAVTEGLERLRELGAALVEISLPKTELAIPAYYVIAPAEASSNLSRFDGVRYGYRAEGYKDLDDMYRRTRSEGFGDEVKRRILIGAYVLSHGYYDAYYLQAQKLRRLIAEDFRTAFDTVDLIAGPVSPSAAWNLGERTEDPVSNYLADIYTLPASLAGLPALSMPAGFAENGRPIGLQLIGRWLEEARLLDAACRFQQVTDWHLRTPPA